MAVAPSLRAHLSFAPCQLYVGAWISPGYAHTYTVLSDIERAFDPDPSHTPPPITVHEAASHWISIRSEVPASGQ